MIEKLTHTEACKLVESSLERMVKILAYVRLKLDYNQPRPDMLPGIGECCETRIKSLVEQANLLCNINHYGAYLQGARRMALALDEWDLLDTPLKKIGSGNYKGTQKRKPKPVNKAFFDLFMENTRNLEWCLHGLPDNIEIAYRPRLDNKGKEVGVEARFVKKEVKYKEV